MRVDTYEVIIHVGHAALPRVAPSEGLRFPRGVINMSDKLTYREMIPIRAAVAINGAFIGCILAGPIGGIIGGLIGSYGGPRKGD